MRKLVEQPWQQTKGEMLDEVTETLSDLLFVEAKCVKRLLFDLFDDFERSNLILKIPELAFVRQAISSSQMSLHKEPGFYLSMLWNRVKWLLPSENLPDVFFKNLEKTRQKLMNTSVWLRAIAPLPETRKLKPQEFPINGKPIQYLNIKEKKLVIADESSNVEIIDIKSGRPIIQKKDNDKNITGIVLIDKENGTATIDKDGFIFFKNLKIEYKTRLNEHLLEWVYDNLIFIRDDDSLVALDPIKNEIKILLEDIPKPLVVFNKSPEGSGILFVAGYRKQICGVAFYNSNKWSVQLLSIVDTPIVAGDINSKMEKIVIATADSIINIVDVEKGKIIKQWLYEKETGSRLRGMAKNVSFGVGPTIDSVFLATETGQVWNWNFSSNRFSSYGDFKKRKEQGTIICMGVWPDTGFPFVSNENNAQTLIPAEISSNISQPVTGICFTKNNHIVAENYEGHSVSYYRAEGLLQIKQFHIDWPLSINQGEGDDTVWIGGKSGFFCKLSSQSVNENESLVAGYPVIGIFKPKQKDMMWIAKANGDIMCMPIIASDILKDKQKIKILWNSTGFEKRLKVLPASENDSFLCMSLVESKQSVTVSLVSAIQIEQIINERSDYKDIAISADFKLFATAGNSIDIYRIVEGSWNLLFSCEEPAKLISFTEDGNFLITAIDNWIYVRKVAEDIPIVTAHDLASSINCLAVQNWNIAAGLQSGDIVSFILESNII